MATFTPPTSLDRHGDSPFEPASRAGHRLLHLLGAHPVGRSVLKLNGVYQTIAYPTVDQTLAATEVYLGGHVYEVSGDVADALEAAGYMVDANPYAFGYGDPY